MDAHVSPMPIKFTKVSIIAMNVECIPPVGFLATQIYVTMGAGDNWFSGTVTKLSPDSLAASCAAHVAVCKSSQLIFAGVKYSMCYDVCMVDSCHYAINHGLSS